MSTPRTKERVVKGEDANLDDQLPEDNLYRAGHDRQRDVRGDMGTRPHIAEAVGNLTRNMQRPTKRHLIAAKRT